MAVANTKSTVVTNADALDGTKTAAFIAGGNVKRVSGTVETAAADDAASVYRLVRVHSSWVISQVLLAHDAITNMSTADVGVYDIATVNSGAVVSVNHFGSAIDISSASAGFVDRTYEATATDISKVDKQLWERLALSSDPNKWYDIAVTATTNDPTAAGTISMIVEYVSNQ